MIVANSYCKYVRRVYMCVIFVFVDVIYLNEATANDLQLGYVINNSKLASEGIISTKQCWVSFVFTSHTFYFKIDF